MFTKCDKKTITIAKSNDAKKISFYILTFIMKLSNIIKVAVFTKLICKKLSASLQKNSIIDNIVNKWSFSLRMLEIFKFNEKIGSYMWVKKAV